MPRKLRLPIVAAAGLAAILAGCGQGSVASDSRKLQVVAAENFWGSIAGQLGGDRVEVTSIITNPATDPHDYEPTSDDARTMAGAQIAIVNGIGYDAWASKLLGREPDPRAGGPQRRGSARARSRGQPPSVVLAARRRAGDRPDQRLLPASGAQRPRLLRTPAGGVQDQIARPLQAIDSRDQGSLPRDPGRRLREHLRAACAGPRPAALDPVGIP